MTPEEYKFRTWISAQRWIPSCVTGLQLCTINFTLLNAASTVLCAVHNKPMTTAVINECNSFKSRQKEILFLHAILVWTERDQTVKWRTVVFMNIVRYPAWGRQLSVVHQVQPPLGPTQVSPQWNWECLPPKIAVAQHRFMDTYREGSDESTYFIWSTLYGL